MASLVKEIDRVIEQHPEKRAGSYVNFLGDDFDRLKTAATEFGQKHKFTRVPLVAPCAFKDGPERLRVHPDAEATVIIYELHPGRVVKANHAIGKDGLSPKAVMAIVADIEKHLQ